MLHRHKGGSPQGEGHNHQDQGGTTGEGGRPAEAASQQEAAGAHQQHAGAIGEVVGGSPLAALLLRQQVCSIGIDHDVLGGTGGGQDQGQQGDQPQPSWRGCLGGDHGKHQQDSHQGDLQHHHPPPAAIGPGDGPTIQEWSPEELEGIGQPSELGDHPDQLQGDATAG